MGDPLGVYSGRLAARRALVERLARADRALSWAYLAGVGALLAVLFFVTERPVLGPGWLSAPVLLLAFVAGAQGWVQGLRRRARRAAAYYERGLARLDGSWAGTGETGERFVPAGHAFARDLDVVGRGSLFQLICTATTAVGQETLARWLTSPPPSPDGIRSRQWQVARLRGALDLREGMAAAGGDAPARIDAAELCGWAEAPPSVDAPPIARALGPVLPALVPVAAIGWAALGWGPVPFLAATLAGLAVSQACKSRGAVIVAQVLRAHEALRALAGVARELEGAAFDDEELRALQADLLRGGRASDRIAALGRRVTWLRAMRNDLLVPLSHAVGGVASLSFAIEAWRRRHGPDVRRWLEAIGRAEALCALAAHAYEHPDDPFPELVERGPVVDGAGLGHPLLPERGFVRNDVRLGDGGPALLLLSGSNMSGKSTFLRTLGVNAVLAFAGAPVRAERLRLSPLALGASLRIQDSLLGGTSRFYAEISRLRAIVELADGPLPVLHLVDEILAGTNSHDRALGAEGVLRALVDKGAIGVCTTHDLALADAAGKLGDRARNVHFGDRLVAGRLHFDYRLKPGVVQQSNALELMRAVGLRV